MRLNLLKLLRIEAALTTLVLFALIGYVASTPAALTEVIDLVRGVVGAEPVAFAENTFYGIADAFQRWTFQGRTTPGFWSPAAAPPSAALDTPSQGTTASALRSAGAAFQPRNLTALYPGLAAPGEGVWIPIPNQFIAAARPLMYKTFLHPDPTRPYARVAIVAMDATRLRLHAVAGTREPASSARVPRPGLIPRSDLASLVAAFNGGFLAIHGHYGMMVDGQTILPPRPDADTIAIYRDGKVRLVPGSTLALSLRLIQSYRQVPPLLASGGQVSPALRNEPAYYWGMSVSGQTAIWRSAFGVSADGDTYFYAAGESLIASRLAEALVAAGASDVAELDVNASLERFLIYAPTTGDPTEQVLLDQMTYEPGMYVSRPASRDFFYLTLR